MAGSSNAVKLAVPAALIKHLESEKKVLVAEKVINQNGLHWSSSYPGDTVFISGSSHDVLEFAVECLESLLDKSRNPLCYFSDKRLEFIFKGTLGKKILESETILTKECFGVFVYDLKDSSEVNVRCVYDDYSKIRKTIDEIRYSTSLSTDRSIFLDKSPVRGRSQYNGHPGSSSTPLVHFQHLEFQYSFKTNNIHVYVYKASITDVTGIDAIVNAANEDLHHDSGVAYTICAAAGSSVKNQCLDHLNKHGRVPVGDNCVTGPGNLMHLKAIIHAVGPHWDDYPDKKKCAMTLHETVINVLRTAHTKSLCKIALPSISAGIFKVPKDLCAEMYIKAVMDYSRNVKPNNVTEIHFVDIKDDILKAIREAHEKWKKSPELLDFKNALKHAPLQGGAGARPLGRSLSNSDREGKVHHASTTQEGEILYWFKVQLCFGTFHLKGGYNYELEQGDFHPRCGKQDNSDRSSWFAHGGASYLPCEVHYIDEKTLPFGGQQTIFKVANTVMVRIYNGSIVKVSDADALVCNVGSDLKGGKLAEIFETAGGALYTKALNDLKKKPPPLVGDVVIHLETGKLKSKYVLLAIMESRRITTMDGKTAQKLKDMYVKILETASLYGMKKIAFTLLGTGMFVKDAQNLECCCNSLFEGLINSQVVRGISVEDIQVVNIHPEVTEAIVRVFHQRSSPSQARSNIEVGEVGGSNSSGGRIPKHNKRGMLIHRTQSSKNPWEHWKKEKKYASMYNPSGSRISQDQDDIYNQGQETGKNPFDDAQLKTRSEQLYKNTCASSSTSSEKDTEEIKLEQKLRDLEVKKIAMIKEKRKKKLEERIKQAEEDLKVLVGQTAYRFPTGTKHEQSNKSTPPMSSSAFEKDREEIELEQKLRELEEKKVIAVKERRKKELKERITQLEEDLSVTEAVPAEDTQEEDQKCLFCTDVLRNPQKLGCGHEFCSKCIGEAFEYQEACPVCGTKFGDDADNQQGLSSDALLSWYNSSDFIEDS